MSRTNPAWGTQEHVRQLERDAFDCCERVIKNWLIVRIIFKTILWIPPLIIFGMFCYANFVFSVLFCFNQLSSLAGYTLLAAFLFITFNIVWGLACTSLIRATISDPGRVPDEYNERMKHEDAVAPISPDNNSHHQISQPTICRRCNVARPPRAHHCRHCGYCVRKMDHHCPVINNCVGWGNYKYFVLLLTWAAVMCLMGSVAAVVKFALIDWQGFTGTEIQLFIGIAVAVIYSFLLIPFAGVHYHMIFNNQTTLESVIPISAYANSHIFDVGKKNNFEQIFGTDKTLWFLPVFTTQGDGCSFPIRSQEINNQMRQNQQALEQYV